MKINQFKNYLCATVLVAATTAMANTIRNVPSQYATIQAAVNACAIGDQIMIANGTYNEQVTIPTSLYGLRISGGSQTGCILQAGQNQTALTINGSDLYIEYLTVQNTYLNGSTTSHAVFANGQHIAFDHCNILGWQDTMAVWNTSVNCYKCTVSGFVDFVYGGMPAFFDQCTITQRSAGGFNCAPNTSPTMRGFVFSSCTIARASGVADNSSTLMRPWGANGETAYINCSMDSHITAAGWSAWNGNEATCRAAEYGSKTLSGATINLSSRSSWCVRLTSSQLSNYSQSAILGGWVPGVTWVPYNKLVNRKTGLYVDGLGHANNGDNCGQYSGNGSINQQWAVETVGSYVKLRNRGSGMYIDGMGRTGNGSAAGQYWGSSSSNQQFTRVNSGGYSTFQNRATGLLLDGMSRTANGSDLGQYPSNGNTSQQFSVQ